jgi:putative copper resistance protein D
MTDWLWLVLRAAGLILTIQAAGAALFSVGFGRRLARAAPAVHGASVCVTVAALAVLALQCVYEPVHLAGDWSGLADRALMRLFLGTSVAAAFGVRFAGLACLGLALRQPAPRAQPLALAGALAAVVSFLLTGHTSVSPWRLWLAPLLFIHLGIVAFWFGSLWPLRQVTALEVRADAAAVVTAFSVAAVWLVPVIALAGAAMALLLLPDVAALWQPYGRLLLTKVGLFALLMGLAALNRLRLTPGLARGEKRAPARLCTTIALEYVLMCATFAVTAVMTGSYSPAPR